MKGKTRSLYRQIIILLMVAILAPLGISSAVSYYNVSKDVKDSFSSLTKEHITNIIDSMEAVNKSSKESIEMLSKDPNAKAILSNPVSPQWLKGSFKGFLDSHKDIAAVYMGLTNGEMLLIPEQQLPKDFDARERGWYQDAIKNKGSVIATEPYKDATDNTKYDITFAKAVEDESGNVVGVIAIDIRLDNLNKIVSEIVIGQSGYALVFDSSGTIIGHKNSDMIGKTSKEDKAVEEMLNNKENMFEEKVNNVNYIVIKEIDKETGYTVIGLIPKEELTSQVNEVVVTNTIVAAALLIIAILGGSKFTRVKIIKPIRKTIDALEEMSKGDFTVRIEKDKTMASEVESMVEAINNTVIGVSDILKNISRASEELKDNSQGLLSITEESSAVGDEVARAVQQIADGAIHQSERINDGVQVAEKLGDKVETSINNSKEMMEAAMGAKNSSNEGLKLVNNLTLAFKETYSANLDVVEKVQQLEENSNKIGAITDVIKGITEQTNLLALNASIEAARAGEAGKGFTVVAEEVRKLAEQSSNSAQEIDKVITEVKLSVNDVFEKLKRSTELNDKTAVNVESTNKSFILIKEVVEELELNIEKVTDSLKTIKEDKDLVITNISEVSAVAEEAAATAEEVSASSEEQASGLQEIVSSAEKLSALSEDLKDMINKFKV